eukprot:SAG31_NODE_44178_length_264_cov_0.581818_1_plen_63_part_10
MYPGTCTNLVVLLIYRKVLLVPRYFRLLVSKLKESGGKVGDLILCEGGDPKCPCLKGICTTKP